MNALRLTPVLISTLFLAAHFFRARNFPLLAIAVGVAVILVIRRRWVPRVVQIALIVGGAEWIRTTVALASAREAAGQSWIRLVAILGAVALFTMCSGLVFRLPRLRERYGA
jgi:hypothetical protein